MAKRKFIQRTSGVESAVTDAIGDVQSLRDEMQDWADNMSSNNMEHLPKYEEVDAAREELDQVADSEPELPSAFPAGFVDEVKWTECHTYARSQSRSTRASDCSAALSAVVDHIEAFFVAHPDENDAVYGVTPTLFDDLREYADSIQEIIDVLDNISFPGMY